MDRPICEARPAHGGLKQCTALGIQRLIDAVDWAGWPYQAAVGLHLIGVDVSAQQNAADFRLRVPAGASGRGVPKLRLDPAASYCGMGGAILIREDAPSQALGLGYDAATRVLYDRSVWGAGDALVLLLRRRLEARHSVEQAGGVFAEVNVAEALTVSGVPGLARR